MKIILLLGLLLYGAYADYKAGERVKKAKIEGLKFKVQGSAKEL